MPKSFERPERGAGAPEGEQEQPAASGRMREGEKPDSFVNKIELLVKANFREITERGEENLDRIPPDRRVIFATTHSTNSDVPIALSVIGKKFHLAVGDASTHRKFAESPVAFVGTKIVGEEHFYSVQHKKQKGVERGLFDPEDFENMEGAFESGKAVMLSAYYHGRYESELSERGGYGAVYLAQIADALIVPVAVDIKSSELGEKSDVKLLMERPNVDVVIGEPIELPKIDGIERIKAILEKRKEGRLSREDLLEFRQLANELRERSDMLMQDIANLLPEEKRGKWGKKEGK